MTASSRSLKAVKPVVRIVYLLLWNSLVLLAFYLNRWQHRIRDPRALAIVTIAVLVTGLTALGVMYVPRVRSLLMKPDAEPADIRKDFAVVALVCMLLGILTLFSALGQKWWWTAAMGSPAALGSCLWVNSVG